MASDIAPIESFASELINECERGDRFTAMQLSVAVRGESVLESAFGYDGVGRLVEADSLFSIYCAAKPLLALLLALLEDRGILPLATTVDSVIPGVKPRVGRLTCIDILSQAACLIQPRGVEGILACAMLKEALASTFDVGPGSSNPACTGYSEFAGWYLLSEIVRRVTGVPVGSLIETEILRPLGLQPEMHSDMTDMSAKAVGRIRSNVSLRDERRMAALIEGTAVYRKYGGNGIGAFSSMRGLSSFYGTLMRLGEGHESSLGLRPVTLRKLTSSSDRKFDVLLQRRCSFGLGFMTDLESHHFGSYISDAAYGHVGMMGMTVAFADPVNGLSVAWHTNGMVVGDTHVGDRRVERVEALYRSLGLAHR